MNRALFTLVTLSFVLAAGCVSTYDLPSSALYTDPDHWLCRPGRDDACSAPRVIVKRGVDGKNRVVADERPVADPGIDCFYLYPTVTMSPIPKNADNFRNNHDNIAAIAKVQAASFRTGCRVFAPYYRQSTIATYLLPEWLRQTYVAVAFADVTAAFDEYMARDNGGRRLVLIGHSQGGELIARLLKARFDTSASMRAKLALAIVTGAPVLVPRGGTVGGTFAHIPTCSRAGETNCVVAYKSFIKGTHPTPETRLLSAPGEEEACVNPATLDAPRLSPEQRSTARVPLKGTLLPPPVWSLGAVKGDDRSLTFTLIRDGYSAACAAEPASKLNYLSIGERMAADDPRRALVPFDEGALRKGLGLHLLDMQFANAELVDLVKARNQAR